MTGDRLDYVIGDMLARMADLVLAPGTFPGLSGPCAPYMPPVGAPVLSPIACGQGAASGMSSSSSPQTRALPIHARLDAVVSTLLLKGNGGRGAIFTPAGRL